MVAMLPATLKDKYHSFREWQKRPHQVKPLSDEEHDCATCGTHYQGNYCPRCGQSSIVGRYSFKKAILLFLDVWGLGNRGMFRTLRDLLLRPGYMIRDYLGGMQMAYFPPFKMFFLLIAFSVLVEGGFNIRLENRLAKTEEKFEQGLKINRDGKSIEGTDATKQLSVDDQKFLRVVTTVKQVVKWVVDHPTIVSLLWLLVFSGPLYWRFRRCPNIPDIRYSEFFVAMVYTNNMMSIYQCSCGILCLGDSSQVIAMALSIIPLKQLSGYSYWRTFFKIVGALALLVIPFILLMGLFGGLIAALA